MESSFCCPCWRSNGYDEVKSRASAPGSPGRPVVKQKMHRPSGSMGSGLEAWRNTGVSSNATASTHQNTLSVGTPESKEKIAKKERYGLEEKKEDDVQENRQSAEETQRDKEKNGASEQPRQGNDPDQSEIQQKLSIDGPPQEPVETLEDHQQPQQQQQEAVAHDRPHLPAVPISKRVISDLTLPMYEDDSYLNITQESLDDSSHFLKPHPAQRPGTDDEPDARVSVKCLIPPVCKRPATDDPDEAVVVRKQASSGLPPAPPPRPELSDDTPKVVASPVSATEREDANGRHFPERSAVDPAQSAVDPAAADLAVAKAEAEALTASPRLQHSAGSPVQRELVLEVIPLVRVDSKKRKRWHGAADWRQSNSLPTSPASHVSTLSASPASRMSASPHHNMRTRHRLSRSLSPPASTIGSSFSDPPMIRHASSAVDNGRGASPLHPNPLSSPPRRKLKRAPMEVEAAISASRLPDPRLIRTDGATPAARERPPLPSLSPARLSRANSLPSDNKPSSPVEDTPTKIQQSASAEALGVAPISPADGKPAEFEQTASPEAEPISPTDDTEKVQQTATPETAGVVTPISPVSPPQITAHPAVEEKKTPDFELSPNEELRDKPLVNTRIVANSAPPPCNKQSDENPENERETLKPEEPHAVATPLTASPYLVSPPRIIPHAALKERTPGFEDAPTQTHEVLEEDGSTSELPTETLPLSLPLLTMQNVDNQKDPGSAHTDARPEAGTDEAEANHLGSPGLEDSPSSKAEISIDDEEQETEQMQSDVISWDRPSDAAVVYEMAVDTDVSNHLPKTPRPAKVVTSSAEADALSDIPSDVDPAASERYLMACRLLKTALIKNKQDLSSSEMTFFQELVLAEKEHRMPSQTELAAAETASSVLLSFRDESDTDYQETIAWTPSDLADSFTGAYSPPHGVACSDAGTEQTTATTDRSTGNASVSITSSKPPLVPLQDPRRAQLSPADVDLSVAAPIIGKYSTDPGVLTPSIMEGIRRFLPRSVATVCRFWLKFSSDQEDPGTTLSHVLPRIRFSTYTVIGVETTHGDVFGAFCSSPWRMRKQDATGNGWYGSQAAFLWKLKDSRRTERTGQRRFNFDNELQVYPYYAAPGDNINGDYEDRIQYCTEKTLAVGGGGWKGAGSPGAMWRQGEPVGLMIDGDLLGGETGSCSTFGNPRLVGKDQHATERTEFEIATLEIWTLTPYASVEEGEQLERLTSSLRGRK